MVTNLPENVKAQWRRVVAAKDPETKLVELLKFYSMVPKHKGTKNLLKQVRRQISKLREEIEERKKRKYKQHITAWEEPKHGVARIGLISDDYFLSAKFFFFLTGLKINNMWKHEPIYGTYSDGTLYFQVVYLPPINISDNLDYRIANYCRTCDILFICLTDHTKYTQLSNKLKMYGISLQQLKTKVEVIRMDAGGIRIIGVNKFNKELLEILRRLKIYNAVVKINGKLDLEELEDLIIKQFKYVPNYHIISFNDSGIIIKKYLNGDHYKIFLNKKDLGEFLIKELQLIRVYTRDKAGNISKNPIILKEGAKVIDLAKIIHSDLAKNMKYAIISRNDSEIRVSKDYLLKDNDIVEIRA